VKKHLEKYITQLILDRVVGDIVGFTRRRLDGQPGQGPFTVVVQIGQSSHSQTFSWPGLPSSSARAMNWRRKTKWKISSTA